MSEIRFRDARGQVFTQEIDAYPDGAPLVARNDKFDIKNMLLRPRSLASFMACMFWIDARAERGHDPVRLVLPFVPGARQDRLNSAGDYLFTVKSIAKIINDRGFVSVTVLDPHSDVAPALIDRCSVVPAAQCINAPAGKYAAVVAPDAGAEKRAALVARKLRVPLLRAWKKRDVATGELTGFGMQPHDLPPGSLVLVVDDICDGGGTFIGLAGVLDAAELKAHLWVTHGLFSKGTSHLLKRYAHVYTTDSVGPLIDNGTPGLIRIPFCEGLL